MARWMWLCAFVGVLSLSSAGGAAADAPLRLPIVFHVAQWPEQGAGEAGTPVAEPSFLTRHLERANAIFAPYGVGFVEAERKTLTGAVRMETRADRHGLGRHVESGVINCFVVASLRDVDDPSRMRQGVHWRSRTVSGAHYVILSVSAQQDVLAHELGHFLGNRRHSTTPGNLMSYARGDVRPFLDARQVRRMRRRLERYLDRGELIPAARSEHSD